MKGSAVGILATILGVVVALGAWLVPFQPVRPSPFDKPLSASSAQSVELPSTAIKLLLRAPLSRESLISFTNADDRDHFSAINFPSEPSRKALLELQDKSFIKIEGGFGKSEPLDQTKLDQLWNEITERYTGVPEPSFEGDYISWKLKNPSPWNAVDRPQLTWMLTDSGSQAVDLILKAVSTKFPELDDLDRKQ